MARLPHKQEEIAEGLDTQNLLKALDIVRSASQAKTLQGAISTLTLEVNKLTMAVERGIESTNESTNKVIILTWVLIGLTIILIIIGTITLKPILEPLVV